MIRTVYRFDNEMVMVFSERGNQMPTYQGRYKKVREAILAAAPSNTKFYHHARWKESSTLVSREGW